MARKVQLGNREVEVQDLSGRKAIRATKIVRSIADGWPEILTAIAEFTRRYEEENFVLLDRAEARHRFAPRPLVVDGELVRDEGGELVLGPDPLGHMTDADWTQSDGRLKVRQSPSRNEVFAAVFPQAFDIAEEQITQLLALAITPNAELSKTAIDNGPEAVEELLKKTVDDFIDEDFGQIMELAVVTGEVVEEQLTQDLKKLGGRTGKFLRLFGLQGPKSPEKETPESTSSRQTSSTSSPGNTDGASDEPSTGPDGSDSLVSSAA